MASIIIHLSGGLIQGVYSNGNRLIHTAIVVDTDTEDADDPDLVRVRGQKGQMIEADVRREPVMDEVGETLAKIVKKHNAKYNRWARRADENMKLARKDHEKWVKNRLGKS